ncbi:MAG: response regulator transcription factor [Bacteroidales bacterium]|jgi:two-component system alkaline phosphatase synthesis response regulator PhoP|nr:response regulator transcription factor [Bacteroidales bacterium]
MAEKTKILLVDDEPDILEFLEYNFISEGYEVKTANNGKTALEIAASYKPQLIVLDIMMLEMDGIETCQEIRKNPENNDVLVVFLTARGEDYSQIAGFEAGSDDYLIKPISPKVLIKRVEAILKRKRKKEATALTDDSLDDRVVINREYYTVLKGKKEIELPRKEFEILSFIASKPNRLFSREEIFNHIWGTDTIVGDRTMDVYIRKIRSKIGDDYIKTVKGVGYKFVQ